MENENKEESKEKDFFKEKTERDFYLIDPANVMAMGKIQDFTDENKPLHLVMDFLRDNSKIEVFSDLQKKETFIVFNDKKFWGKYSLEYYDRAKKVCNDWGMGEIRFYVGNDRDMPILMSCEDLGFVLAPRIESEESW